MQRSKALKPSMTATRFFHAFRSFMPASDACADADADADAYEL
jgi:hypothetical protein